jgi:hypothetical protein
MRKLLFVILTVISAGLASAEDAKYNATMTGIMCGACKQKVRLALAKLDSTQINFTAGEKEGETKVTFVSKKASLTKDDATKALGEAAKEFTVVTLAKAS